MFAPASLGVDIAHCTKMALIHDMAEALVGDITPVDGVPKHEKNRRESTTMDYMTKTLLGRVNGGLTAQGIRDIWQEYEDGKTKESIFVHDVDKLELLLQMVEYERANDHQLDLGEFSWVASRVELPEMKEWSAEILKEREDFWGSKPHSSYQADGKKVKNLEAKLEYYSHELPGNGEEKKEVNGHVG